MFTQFVSRQQNTICCPATKGGKGQKLQIQLREGKSAKNHKALPCDSFSLSLNWM
jgi:hypothetical protein